MRDVEQVRRQVGIRREKGRHRLCVGTPPLDFHPISPADFPVCLNDVVVMLGRCTIAQGVCAARKYNTEQLRHAPADRRWAVVIHGLDQRQPGVVVSHIAEIERGVG